MLFTKKNLVFKHTCDLPREIGRDITPSPYAPAIFKYCFRLRRYFTISKNFNSEQFFRSNASFEKEKRRHLTTRSYRYVIHPFSPVAMAKRVIVCFLWLATFIVDPFLGSFVAKKHIDFIEGRPVQASMYAVLQVLLLVDLVSRFFVGYIVEQTRHIVLLPKKIVKNYLLSYFVVDFLPIIPMAIWLLYPDLPERYEFLIYQTTAPESDTYRNANLYQKLQNIRTDMLRMVRFIRIKSLVHNFEASLTMAGFSEPVRVIMILCIAFFLIIHLWTCMLAFAPMVHEFFNIPYTDSWLTKLRQERVRIKQEELTVYHDYLQHATLVMCHFFGAGVGRYRTANPVEWLFLSLIVVQGMCYYVYALARVTQLFGMVNISESKYEELVAQAGEYMLRKKIPRRLRRHIATYYDYKFDKTYFSEQLILQNLSEHLRMEVLLYSCRNLVEKVQLLRGLSKAAVGSILVLLKQEVYLKGDIVMRSNQNDSALHFILYGTCAVVLESGRELMHIEDGYHFGDQKELQDVVYNVVALEPSVIYSLSKEDMAYCCKHYPEIAFRLANMPQSKTNLRILLASLESEADFRTNTILAELRKGNILEQGRRRGKYLS